MIPKIFVGSKTLWLPIKLVYFINLRYISVTIIFYVQCYENIYNLKILPQINKREKRVLFRSGTNSSWLSAKHRDPRDSQPAKLRTDDDDDAESIFVMLFSCPHRLLTIFMDALSLPSQPRMPAICTHLYSNDFYVNFLFLFFLIFMYYFKTTLYFLPSALY